MRRSESIRRGTMFRPFVGFKKIEISRFFKPVTVVRFPASLLLHLRFLAAMSENNNRNCLFYLIYPQKQWNGTIFWGESDKKHGENSIIFTENGGSAIKNALLFIKMSNIIKTAAIICAMHKWTRDCPKINRKGKSR